MTPNGRKRYMDEFYTSRDFQRHQEHPNRTSNDKVMTLGSLRNKRRELKSYQLEYLKYSVFIMISKVLLLGISIFYTSRSFQRYQEHPNRSSNDKVKVLRSWSKNRKVATTS